jgi:Tol biopolymer transport system component
MKGFVRAGVMLGLGACAGGETGGPQATALSPDGQRLDAISYSPDGSRIAYWSPGDSAAWQLWVASADLSAPRKMPAVSLFGGIPPVWSPDGSRIASWSSEFGTADVVVMPTAGGAPQRVTQGPGFEVPVGWYPDGDRLAYVASAQGGTIRSFEVSVSTGTSKPLVPSEKRPVIGTPSPDGSHLGYVVIDGPRSTVWVADSDGGNPRQLTTEGFENYSGNAIPWSPDGKELAYESRRTGTADIWVVAIDGGQGHQLTRDVRNDYLPTWSPDGKWIAFLSDRGRQTDVWVVPAGGGEERRVTDTPDDESGLSWRPGTVSLSFTAATRAGGAWVVDLTSGQERRITPDSLRSSWFNVSPDGQQIDYVIDRGGGIADLAVMPIGGGMSRTLVAGGGAVNAPYWSPDGSKIVFTSDRGGSMDVWVVDGSGGAPRQLTNWPSAETVAVWSGDGTTVLFRSDRDSKLGDLWKVPVSGGEPTRVTNNGTLGGALVSRAGVADIFVQTINPNGGQLGFARVRADGSLQTVWDRTNAFMASVSPSGDSVAALVEQPDGKLESMILPAAAGAGRVILGSNDQVSNWSKDGKSLLYETGPSASRDLGILNLADGTTRRLTTTPESEGGAEFTPDGKSVVFVRNRIVERIYSVDLSQVLGGAKP